MCILYSIWIYMYIYVYVYMLSKTFLSWLLDFPQQKTIHYINLYKLKTQINEKQSEANSFVLTTESEGLGVQASSERESQVQQILA